MPGDAIAEYGIAFFAVAGLIYLFAQLISLWFRKGEKDDMAKAVQAVTEVVENNTEALNRLENLIEVSLARQDVKLEELVAYARRNQSH